MRASGQSQLLALLVLPLDWCFCIFLDRVSYREPGMASHRRNIFLVPSTDQLDFVQWLRTPQNWLFAAIRDKYRGTSLFQGPTGRTVPSCLKAVEGGHRYWKEEERSPGSWQGWRVGRSAHCQVQWAQTRLCGGGYFCQLQDPTSHGG